MGTCQNRLIEAVLTSTHNQCFEKKCEKYQNFSSENFPFLVLKFSIYLNRRVFVMTQLFILKGCVIRHHLFRVLVFIMICVNVL